MQKIHLNKGLLSIFLVIVIVIASGIALGFYYSSLPGHHPQKNKQACESVGGEWLDDEKICLVSNKEAGERCTDGGQCISGICFPPELTEEQKIILMREPLKNMAGTCYADNFPTGCVEQVIMGEISKESMCSNNK